MNGISCVQNVSTMLQNDERNQDSGILNKKLQKTAGLSQ